MDESELLLNSAGLLDELDLDMIVGNTALKKEVSTEQPVADVVDPTLSSDELLLMNQIKDQIHLEKECTTATITSEEIERRMNSLREFKVPWKKNVVKPPGKVPKLPNYNDFKIRKNIDSETDEDTNESGTDESISESDSNDSNPDGIDN
jgi:hypothetical protein